MKEKVDFESDLLPTEENNRTLKTEDLPFFTQCLN